MIRRIILGIVRATRPKVESLPREETLRQLQEVASSEPIKSLRQNNAERLARWHRHREQIDAQHPRYPGLLDQRLPFWLRQPNQ